MTRTNHVALTSLIVKIVVNRFLGLAVLLALAMFFLFPPALAWAKRANDAVIITTNGCITHQTILRGTRLVVLTRACADVPAELSAGTAALTGSNPVVYLAFIQNNTGAVSSIEVTGDGASTYHIVQSTDTLSGIADEYGTSIDVLMMANPEIVNPNIIYDGISLRIPPESEIPSLQSAAEKRREEEQRQIVSSVPHGNERWIDVDLSTQTVRAYEGDTLMNTFLVSTGTAHFPTITGQFNIWIKFRYDDMTGPGYNLPDVPYVMYFYKDYALHGTYWHHNFGTPMSHGCVNLRTEDAAWLYDFSSVGTMVNVHE